MKENVTNKRKVSDYSLSSLKQEEKSLYQLGQLYQLHDTHSGDKPEVDTSRLKEEYGNSFNRYVDLLVLRSQKLRYSSIKINAPIPIDWEMPDSLFELKNLRVLDLAGINLQSIPKSIARLTKLRVLILKRNRISELPEEISQLRNLKKLIIGKNPFMDSLEHFEWPPNLEELHLSSSRIQHIPQSVFNLKKLKTLWLSDNYISDVSKEIAKLENLQRLFINQNQLNDLPEELYHAISLKGLYVEGNPLKNIPIYEWSGNKLLEWKTYYREILEGETKNYKAKLIFLGQGETGKSTLMERLRDPSVSPEKLKKNISQTHGIVTEQLKGLKTKNEDEKEYNIELSMWDFGGQEIQRSIHSFFLTENALFLLVWTARGVDDKYAYFKRWLKTIETYGGQNSRVILIQNKAFGKDQYREVINQKSLQEEFPQLKQFIDIGALDGIQLGMEEGELLQLVKQEILQLPKVGETIPISWENIKDTLEQQRKQGLQFIKKQAFIELCEKSNVEKDSADQMLDWLHQIGVVIHYQKKHRLIRDYIILDPKWLTEQVYAILLDREDEIRENNGRLTSAMLNKLGESQSNLSVILEFMTSFKLCFELEGEEETYIIPMQLPDAIPEEAEEIRKTLDALNYEYRYIVMPKGLIGQFIAAAYRHSPNLIEKECFWSAGAVLKYQSARGLVEFKLIPNLPYETIAITVVGERKQALLSRVQDILNTLNETIRHPINEFTYCSNGGLCREKKSTPIAMDTIYRLQKQKGIKDLQCLMCFEMLSVENLLNGLRQEDVQLRDLKNKYVIKQRFQEAIDILKSEYGQYLSENELLSLESQLNLLKTVEHRGTSDKSHVEQTYNKLTVALLELIDKVEGNIDKS